VEKRTFNLSLEVLKRFERSGILKHLVLIGSWSVYFYKYYFNSNEYSTFIRTMDIDFLIPIPAHFHKKVRIFSLLEDLGFIEEYKGSKGYTKISHPDLTVEFLVPERGPSHDKPYPIPQLSINAVPLRYLDFLAENTISIKAEGLHITLPHPAAYALHKFIIFKRRRNIDKHDRDIEGALRVFRQLISHGDSDAVKRIFKKMHKKWQKTVRDNLKSIKEAEALDILTR
jgi:hypothetical protein